MEHALAQLFTASARLIVDGKTFRAWDVAISSSGIKRTKCKRGETSKRSTVQLRATVKPPKDAGAALSGCPSNCAHNWKIDNRSSDLLLNPFKARNRPTQTVTLPPGPGEP